MTVLEKIKAYSYMPISKKVAIQIIQNEAFMPFFYPDLSVLSHVRNGDTILLNTGAKLYSRKIGNSPRYFISGYLINGVDVLYYYNKYIV